MSYELAMNMTSKHASLIIVSTTIFFWNILATNIKIFCLHDKIYPSTLMEYFNYRNNIVMILLQLQVGK